MGHGEKVWENHCQQRYEALVSSGQETSVKGEF